AGQTQTVTHTLTPRGNLACPIVAVCKVANIRRHFETRHSDFNENFPAKSEIRRQKIASLIASYNHSVTTIHKTTSAQENATTASLRVSWNLAKAKKPFTDAELIKTCAIDMVEEVLSHDEKTRKTVVDLLKHVPLSDNTAMRRVEVLAEDCLCDLLSRLKKTDFVSLAIDTSCDRTDIEQLSVFVRFFDEKDFREELLCLLPLHGRTTGEAIFSELTQFFERNGLDISKVTSVVTDGAPSMVGQQKGLVSRLAAVIPALTAFHCIIHKSVLCAKLCGKMKDTMDNVMKLVNFIRESSSLQHRLFRALLEEMSAAHHDLLLHNDVRWLSKGRVFERVCELHDELCSFLGNLQNEKAHSFLKFLNDSKEMAFVHFLCDITSHLNQLNLQLQGKNHTIADMYEAVEAFRLKLDLFQRDIQGRKLHFPQLQQHCEKNKMQEDAVMQAFLGRLIENFKVRFESFNLSSEILLFLRQPFSVSADGQWTAEAKRLLPSLDEASLQMEILEISKSDLLKEQHKDVSVTEFWINMIPQFSQARQIAMLLLTAFPSTYICESSFSSMNIIKSQDRNKLSSAHLEQCLRIATTEHHPNFRSLVSTRRCHFSH
uniref:DUF4371 domain-containing protein n=1 Tax=Pygocentrus nattereri TaxID=42514 RepID=A0AAR2LE77_PYGNA